MRRLLDDVGFAPATLPAVDVIETDDEFVLELEVPGYEEKELKIEAFGPHAQDHGRGHEDEGEGREDLPPTRADREAFERRSSFRPRSTRISNATSRKAC